MYHSSNESGGINSRRLRWAGHVARMDKGRSALIILKGTPEGRRPLEGQGLDGSTILERILKKWG